MPMLIVIIIINTNINNNIYLLYLEYAQISSTI